MARKLHEIKAGKPGAAVRWDEGGTTRTGVIFDLLPNPGFAAVLPDVPEAGEAYVEVRIQRGRASFYRSVTCKAVATQVRQANAVRRAGHVVTEQRQERLSPLEGGRLGTFWMTHLPDCPDIEIIRISSHSPTVAELLDYLVGYQPSVGRWTFRLCPTCLGGK